jgi:hypothetical protein
MQIRKASCMLDVWSVRAYASHDQVKEEGCVTLTIIMHDVPSGGRNSAQVSVAKDQPAQASTSSTLGSLSCIVPTGTQHAGDEYRRWEAYRQQGAWDDSSEIEVSDANKALIA